MNCEQQFFNNLRVLRVRNGHKQFDVARLLNVNRTTYSGWERSITPPVKQLKKICKHYNVTADQMLTTQL